MKAVTFTVNSYSACVKKCAELLSRTDENPQKNFLVFCEDKLTVTLEREILNLLNPGCTFNTEVSSFSRYLFRKHRVKSTISKEGSVMAVRRIIEQKRGGLSILGGAAGRKNPAFAVYELIAQLRSAKIAPKDISGKGEGLLHKKLSDLGVIYSEYLNFLETGGYLDESGALSLLPGLIREGDLSDTEVFFVGYSSFTRQMAGIIEAFLDKAAIVTGIFTAGEALDYFSEILRKKGGLDRPEYFEYPLLKEAELIGIYLFSPECFKLKERTETRNISLFEAEDIYDEIRFIAEQIAFNVRKGKRYRDFTILLPSLPEYAAAIGEELRNFEIPFFMDEQKTLSESPAVRLVISQIEISRKNYSKEDVISFIKNPLFKAGLTESDDFENYVLKYGITRKAFFEEFKRGTEEYPYAEALRREFAESFVPLNKKDRAEDFVKGIKELLSRMKVETKLKSFSDRFSGGLSGFNDQVYDKLNGVLDQITGIMGDTELKIEEFKNIFQSGADSGKISAIPAFLDAVYVGSITEYKGQESKYLFAAGLSGDVPALGADTSVLSDRDISFLEKAGVNIEPKISIVNQRTLERTSSALSSFTERLFLSYPLLSPAGKPQKKSGVFDYIDRIFSLKGNSLKFLTRNQIEELYRHAPDENRLTFEGIRFMTSAAGLKSFAALAGDYIDGKGVDFNAASAFYKTLEGEDKSIADGVIENLNFPAVFPLEGEQLLGGGYISASYLENYFDCPYMFFAEKILKLKEREVFEFRPADLGNFLHRVVEEFVKKDILGGDPEENCLKSIEEVLSEEAFARRSGEPYFDALFSMLKKEALKNCAVIDKQLKNTEFKVLGTEISFGGDGDFPPLKLNAGDREFYLVGKVDRADATDTHIRVVDYKSGRTDSGDKQLFLGRKLQLYLYMSALSQSTGKQPAGVYYYPISDKFSDGENENLLKGHSLADTGVLLAQDTLLSPINPVSDILSAKLKTDKDGVLTASGSSFLSEKTFDGFLKYAKKVSEKALDEISKGYIASSPFKDVCRYCKMGGVCGYDEEAGGRTRKAASVRPDTIETAATEDGE